MKLRGLTRGAMMATAVFAAALWFVPSASAHSHVSIGVGISVPGVTVGVGNCWRCGYWTPAPVYYQPVYPAPAYYPAPVYYAPRPVYYGDGYYVPRYRYYPRYYRHGWDHDRRGHDGHYRHHDDGDDDD